MEHIDFLEVILQVLTLVGPEDAQREADKGPQVNHP
jgi:hypothetical protein